MCIPILSPVSAQLPDSAQLDVRCINSDDLLSRVSLLLLLLLYYRSFLERLLLDDSIYTRYGFGSKIFAGI